MRWFIYLLLSLPVAVVGGVAGGLIGNACTRWYRISSFEGGAGYYVLGLIIAGTVVGGLAGVVTFGVSGPLDSSGYGRTFGAAIGILAALAGTVTLLAWALADIPPELDGRPLVLEVELRLPAGAQRPEPATGESHFRLHSIANARSRAHADGSLHFDRVRKDGDRWIVPAEASLFTRRGGRSIDVRVDGGDPFGFLVSLPASPGRRYAEWSEWLPQPKAPNPPWPDSKPSYRYRVVPEPEPAPQPTYAEVAAEAEARKKAAFEALSPSDPLHELLQPLRYGQGGDEKPALIAKIQAKTNLVDELRQELFHADAERAADALRILPELGPVSHQLRDDLVAVGRDVAERIRRFNSTPVEQDPSYLGAADVSIRFSAWRSAIAQLRRAGSTDFIPELVAILDLSRARPDSIAMRGDVCRVASFYLKEWAGIEPLATDPKPR